MLFLWLRPILVGMLATAVSLWSGWSGRACIYMPQNRDIFNTSSGLKAQLITARDVYVYEDSGKRWCSRLIALEPVFGRMQSRYTLDGAYIPAFSDRHEVLFYITKGAALPAWYVPSNLVRLYTAENGRTVYVRPDVRRAFLELKKAAQRAGYIIYANSGFRSFRVQDNLFKGYISYDNTAPAYSAVPGSSQHQTGLVIDIGAVVGGRRINYGNFRLPQARRFRAWLQRNAPKYGFVQPYVSYTNKGDIAQITGYVPEPWHLYYIGPKLAQEFLGSNLEFFPWLRSYLASDERFVKIVFRSQVADK